MVRNDKQKTKKEKQELEQVSQDGNNRQISEKNLPKIQSWLKQIMAKVDPTGAKANKGSELLLLEEIEATLDSYALFFEVAAKVDKDEFGL